MKDSTKIAIAMGVATGIQYAQSGILWQAILAGIIAGALSKVLITTLK